MKTSFIYLLLVGMMVTACNTNPNKASTDTVHIDATADSSNAELTGAAVITFEKTVHDFDKITQGEKAEYSFKFTNTGKGQLLISNATATCGCTVPSYSKDPINPGESGYIKVIFDSDGRLDRFEKSVTVTSNTTPTETVLYIVGMVIPKPEDQYKIMHQ